MRPHSRPAIAGVLMVMAASLLHGQGKPPADETTTFTSDTHLVALYATVVDKSGKLVTNLTQKAFKVFENGVEQSLKKVLREDVPVSLGLIIDNSGSMRNKRQKVADAALALVRASNPEDEVFIVNFNDEPYLDTPFTSDIKELERGLSKIDTRGGTAMRDAISVSIDYLKENAKRDKKVLVVVTDGEDNYSNISVENLIRKAQQSEGVVIYTIGLLSEEEKREAKKATRALTAIAEASGGVPYLPKETSDMEKVCQQVARDIRSQYILEYTPSNTALDGSFRQIKVAVNGPNRPTARTRSGYYATATSSLGTAKAKK